MNSTKPITPIRTNVVALLLGVATLLTPRLEAQLSRVLFSEDFESGTLDPARFAPLGQPEYMTGESDITADVEEVEGGNRLLRFHGVASSVGGAGATLRVIPTFKASQETNLVISVNRVSATGLAWRGGLWLMSTNGFENFVHLSGWRPQGRPESESGLWLINRDINAPIDDRSGFGVFSDTWRTTTALNDFGLHTLKLVADGRTVKFYLDEIYGGQSRFPFNEVVVALGAYAVSEAVEIETSFDDLSISSVPVATFGTEALTVTAGQPSRETVTVRIPEGANADGSVVARVVSSNPNVAVAEGAAHGVLILTFAKGEATQKAFRVLGTGGPGGAELTFETDSAILAGNSLKLTAEPTAPGVKLEDDFSGPAIDPTRWTLTKDTLIPSTGKAEFAAEQAEGVVTLSGGEGGAPNSISTLSLRSVASFNASKELPLVVTLDLASFDPRKQDGTESSVVTATVVLNAGPPTGQVNGSPVPVSKFYLDHNVFFGDHGWELYAQDPRNDWDWNWHYLESDTEITAGPRSIKLVADGETVSAYHDGKFQGSWGFPVASGIHLEFGGGTFGFAPDDRVSASFDNVRVVNEIGCIAVSPADTSVVVGEVPRTASITIPRLLNESTPATVTLTSSDPSVVVPEGAVDGSLQVVFPAAGPVTQQVRLVFKGIGSTTLLASSPGACAGQEIHVSVSAPPTARFTDTFSTGVLDESNWRIDNIALRPDAVAGDDVSVTVEDGALKIQAADTTGAYQSGWSGFTVWTTSEYHAEPTAPVTFEFDRVSAESLPLSSSYATGLWVSDASRHNFVFFRETRYRLSGDGDWKYDVITGSEDGFLPNPYGGTSIPAFNKLSLNDSGNHRLRAVVYGSTVKLFLDDLFGVEVPFALNDGIVFGLGAYAPFELEIGAIQALAKFDNAQVLAAPRDLANPTAARLANGDVEVTWTGPGILQSSTSLASGATWSDVSPAPAGNTLTIQRAAQAGTVFYRLRR